MNQPFKITGKIKLKDFDPDFHDGRDKEETKAKTARFCQRIADLQEMLYANASHSIIIMLQGMDASGKDGTVRRVLHYVNPAGVETANFKTPSAEEQAHDFLWRIHKALPRYGNLGIFNRSHYEQVLITRVLGLEPPNVWRAHYEQINAFEKYLSQNRVVLLKFFLHISKEEQAARFEHRLENPSDQWKFSTADLEMRKHWPAFQEAYEEAINRCSTSHTPWHLVPANHRWYRDYVVSKTVMEAMEALNLDWPKPKEDLSKIVIR